MRALVTLRHWFILVAVVVAVVATAGAASAASGDVVNVTLRTNSQPFSLGQDVVQDPYFVVTDSAATSGMTISATGLPPGLTLYSQCEVNNKECEGWLTGTPTEVGAYTVEVTATDATGASGTLSFPANVRDVIALSYTPVDYPTIGQSVSLPVTATSAADTALDFTVTGLPPGLSYASTATNAIAITGTPTTVGQYTTTVTATNPAGGSETGTIVMFVHGTITLASQANITGTIGGSGAVIMRATDSVKSASVSYQATGLPPGVGQQALATSPVFAGWTTKAGTYHVTVTAYDDYQATASVSFTWTVLAATDTGPTGPIGLNLGGKCLDGNGTQVRIWTCNGSSTQEWTLASDWTVRRDGKCLTETGTKNGSKTDLASCNGTTAQQWEIQGGPQGNPELTSVASGRCLDDTGLSTSNGTTTQIWNCNGGTNQTWTPPAGAVASEIPGMCLADPANQTANGTRIVFWQCEGWHEEAWTYAADGELRINGKCLDDEHNSTANGAAVVLEPCNDSTGERWQFYAFTPGPSGGELQNWNGNAVGTDANTATNGTPVSMYVPGQWTGIYWRP
jgi:Ricin-type beta-trefoil lectin domain/Putative Ig domain